MNVYLESKQEDLQNSVDFFQKSISSLRIGRANSGLLDGIFVEVYGTRTPLQGLANIKLEDAKSIIIEPWDKGIIKDIEKEIVSADLGVFVANEGEKIRLKIPEMTEEKRREVVKKLNEKHENARISLRQIRDEIKKEIEKAEDNKEITGDEKYDFISELDKEIGNKNQELKDIRDRKEKDIMKI